MELQCQMNCYSGFGSLTAVSASLTALTVSLTAASVSLTAASVSLTAVSVSLTSGGRREWAGGDGSTLGQPSLHTGPHGCRCRGQHPYHCRRGTTLSEVGVDSTVLNQSFLSPSSLPLSAGWLHSDNPTNTPNYILHSLTHTQL